MKMVPLSMTRRTDWAVAAILVGLFMVTLGVIMASSLPQTTVHLGRGTFHVQIAVTEASRLRGLGGASPLTRDEGMLFVFPDSERWGIWMKAMRYPIDVVWLNDQKRVVYSVSNMSPSSYPRVYAPTLSARYVIELAAGTIMREAIRQGANAQFVVPSGQGA